MAKPAGSLTAPVAQIMPCLFSWAQRNAGSMSCDTAMLLEGLGSPTITLEKRSSLAIPPGKRLQNYGQPPLWENQLTTWPFLIAMYVYQRVDYECCRIQTEHKPISSTAGPGAKMVVLSSSHIIS